MKKLTSFFSRLAGTVIQAAPAGTVAGALIFYIVAVVYSIMTGDRKVLYTAVGFAVLNAAGIAGAMILKLPENFHKYDQDIIGRNFVGVSKKCRLFSHSLDLLFSHRANAALEELKMLESVPSEMHISAAKFFWDIPRCFMRALIRSFIVYVSVISVPV